MTRPLHPVTAARGLWLLPAVLSVLSLSACERGGGGGHAGHDDHGPPGESSDIVALTSEQLTAAKVEVAAAGPEAVEERLSLTAVVRANLDAQAHITPKVPGLVRAIRKHLGERVEAGEVVCELESTELGQAVSRYLEARAMVQAARGILEQETALLERKVEVAQTILDREGRLKEQEITTLRPFYEAERALAETQLERQSRLLELRSALQQREIARHTAEEQLHILGMEQEEIERLAEERDHSHGHYRLRAPRAGVIVARDVTENEFVGTDDKLFLVQDLSRVWVMASAYEKDLRHIARGQTAVVRLDAFPGVELRGEVTFIQYEVGRVSRAAEVRVELPNEPLPGWREQFPLRPGMFGKVEVVLSARQARVVIPEQAVVHEGERDFVFVRLPQTAPAPHEDEEGHGHEEEGHGHEEEGHDEGSAAARVRFQRRAVELGVHSGDRVEVLRGLEPGDDVVTGGAFSLKSLARQGELGGGHSH